jgi:iron complex outermembrane receptor protein
VKFTATLTPLATAIALLGLTPLSQAQTSEQRVEITGSSIKRIASEGSLPVQIITRQDLERQGIVTAEQLISSLSVNGNGLDNLASNADVVAGAARGNNGASCANLRGQGCAATLVLLNGRRIAAHGLNGGVVDLNSIPMAAVERIEILKDGASAIYGTDAIGGVMNFILRKNFSGLEAQAFADVTEAGGGSIARVKLVGGLGNLDTDKYNLLVAFSHSENKALRGDQRDFVNTFQPNRGLSVDTRGTPYATAFAISSLYSALSRDNVNTTGRSTGPTLPGGGTQTYNGINVLDLPGQAGCSSIDGMGAYDEVLWATPAAKYGCAWDTGRAAVLQQPVKNTNLVARATVALGEHQLYAEFAGAKVESAKSFSANQISSSTGTTSPFFNLAYPSTGTSYNTVFNALVGTFPQLEANRGLPIAFRWRCLECGPRQIDTSADTARFLLAADGPLGGGWDYKVGASTASSEATSLLGNGYFFGREFAALINTGVLNPFLAAGQSQTPEALSALAATSANGVTLYGGKFTVQQFDGSVTGPVFKLPAGEVMAAVGADVRTEKFRFNGNATDLATQARVFNAPFDSINSLNTVKRDIKALYGEVLVPVVKGLELTVAARHDDYTGFGGTTNPKVSLRFTPMAQFLVRGSYNTGFRVPTFNQLFFGVTESPYSGKDLVDPGKCPTGKVDTTKPGCESITPTILSGGKPNLGPEESKQWTTGFVWEPMDGFSLGADLWSIRKTGTIQSLALADLVANSALFPDNFIRDASNTLVAVDTRWVNAGESITKGIDVNARANGRVAGARWGVVLEGSYLLEKKSRLIASAPFGGSEVGVFSRAGDLGLRWKHSLTGTYSRGPWTGTLVQQYRAGYKDAVLPGVANGSVVPADWNPDVKAYTLYNASVSYTGIKNMGLTFGIKNLLDKDPPFSAAYDGNTGAGSSWEPRVADPRGRAFTFQIDYKFF